MSQKMLAGVKVLVAEDEFAVAEYVCEELREYGAEIVGPAGSLAETRRRLTADQVHVALLDVNLRGEMVFPVLEQIRQMALPCLLVTGYDDSIIPSQFADVPRCTKPVSMDEIIARLVELAGASA